MWCHSARLWKVPHGWSVVAVSVALGVVAYAQASASPAAGEQQREPQTPVFRSGVTLVTTDVIVRDASGQFVSDLSPDEFSVYENDVRQEVSSLVLVHGGRVFDVLTPP
jgi:hypothetical protein